jgi:uncharacterized protein (TIGR03435 family)
VKKLILAVLTIAAAVAAQALLSAQLPPAGPPVDPNAQFEAASIKSADPSSPGSRMMMMPGRVEADNVPVRLLLRPALRVQDYQIVGLPDWVGSERYTIVAKAPDGAPQNAMPVMLANLLKERFKFATHSETREMQIFNLVVARQDGKLGSGLKVTSPECQTDIQSRRGGPPPAGPGGPGGAARGPATAPPPPPPLDFNAPIPCGMMRVGPGLANASGQPIAQVVQFLAQFTGRPVYDKTGLTGMYDFNLKWALEPGGGAGPFGAPPPGAQPPPVDPDAPNIYTAVQEQLGLKLESAKGPVDVIVVDRIERPSLD